MLVLKYLDYSLKWTNFVSRKLVQIVEFFKLYIWLFSMCTSMLSHRKQERIQSNANHPLAESVGYIKSEGM